MRTGMIEENWDVASNWDDCLDLLKAKVNGKLGEARDELNEQTICHSSTAVDAVGNAIEAVDAMTLPEA